MPKSSKPKKKQEADIHVGGNVIGDNIVIGSYNKITFQEVLKTTYGLFTIPQPVQLTSRGAKDSCAKWLIR